MSVSNLMRDVESCYLIRMIAMGALLVVDVAANLVRDVDA